MPEPTDNDADYCSDLVRRRDEDRWLATRFAGEEDRRRAIALYALHLEIRQTPAAVSEPPLGEIRLQWWREAIEEAASGGRVRAHPVVSFAARTGAVTEQNRALLDDAIDARAHLLYGEPFGSVEAFFTWLDRAEGYLALARRFQRPALSTDEADALIRAESIFHTAQHMTMTPDSLAADVLGTAPAFYETVRPVLAKMSAQDCAAHLHLCLTPFLLAGKAGAFAPLGKRLRLFKAMASGQF